LLNFSGAASESSQIDEFIGKSIREPYIDNNALLDPLLRN